MAELLQAAQAIVDAHVSRRTDRRPVADDVAGSGLVRDDRECERTARRLAQANVPFLATDGVIVRAPNVASGFDERHDLERVRAPGARAGQRPPGRDRAGGRAFDAE